VKFLTMANLLKIRDGMNRKLSILLTLIILLIPSVLIHSAQDEVITVTLTGDETLRSLAVKYFGEPNDWEVILFYNGFQSTSEVNIGTQLKIPISLYRKFNKTLDSVQELIIQANNEGAGILAKEQLDSGIKAQKEAIELKKKGKLDQAFTKAQEAQHFIQDAIKQTKEKRIKSISAILSERKGKVQSRKQDQSVWFDANQNQELIEKEHVRTLTGSSGEISFLDGSRLNLSQNSLAVIEAMKQDLIKNTSKSSVVVLQGDVLAYLTSQNKKNDVNVSVPGVQTDIRSRNFRTSMDENNVAKFANYDGEIEVQAAGSSVTLKKNEGTSIAPGEKPKEARKLLDPPTVITPEPKTKIFSNILDIKWNKITNAKGYRIQISTKRAFSEMLLDEATDERTTYQWQSKATGVFYLRIASIDKENFTGPFTSPIEFYLDKDVTPPYLLIESPAENESVYKEKIALSGVVEISANLMVNGDTISTGADGKFNQEFKLKPGKNLLNIQAVDPAGNKSEIVRTVYYNADDRLIYLDSKPVVSINTTEFAVSGSTKPGTEIQINGQSVQLVDYKFNHIVTLQQGENQVIINAKSQKGQTQSSTLTITLDQQPPDVSLEDIPSFTKEASVEIAGKTDEPCRISINKEVIPTEQNQFKFTEKLQEGENVIELIAEDLAGNQNLTEIEIVRDTQKPKVLSVSLVPEQVKGGELVQVKIQARDDGAGLSRNGKFSIGLAAGGQNFSGMLSLGSGGTYLGTLIVPPGIQGKLTVRELVIQDYLGNQADYP
jgi:hypothetical protein